jgi:hypothetical protein
MSIATKQSFKFLLLMRTMMVQKDEMVVSGVKKRMAEEMVTKGIEDIREALKGLEDKGEVGVVVPDWCRGYTHNDFRMWIFEQNANLYSNKFENVVKNL